LREAQAQEVGAFSNSEGGQTEMADRRLDADRPATFSAILLIVV